QVQRERPQWPEAAARAFLACNHTIATVSVGRVLLAVLVPALRDGQAALSCPVPLLARTAPSVFQCGLPPLGAGALRLGDAERAAAEVFRLIEICFRCLACDLFVHSVSFTQYSSQPVLVTAD